MARADEITVDTDEHTCDVCGQRALGACIKVHDYVQGNWAKLHPRCAFVCVACLTFALQAIKLQVSHY